MIDRGTPTVGDIALQDARAAFMRRWAAWSIDLVLVAFLVLVVNRLVPEAVRAESPLLAVLVALVVATLYFWIPEAIWGATVGKFAAKVRVVDSMGRPPGYARALVRTLSRFVEANPFLFGALPAALVASRSKTGRRLGDILAKTYVLRTIDLRRLSPGRSAPDPQTTREFKP